MWEREFLVKKCVAHTLIFFPLAFEAMSLPLPFLLYSLTHFLLKLIPFEYIFTRQTMMMMILQQQQQRHARLMFNFKHFLWERERKMYRFFLFYNFSLLCANYYTMYIIIKLHCLVTRCEGFIAFEIWEKMRLCNFFRCHLFTFS